VIDVTLHLFNVLAAYVTLETGQISQNFLSIKFNFIDKINVDTKFNLCDSSLIQNLIFVSF
jgi:hypothetical protein